MKKFLVWIKDNWALLYFCLGVTMLVFAYGVAVGSFHIFPYPIFKKAERAATELWSWVELYLPGSEDQHPHVIVWSQPGPQPDADYPASGDLTFVLGYRPGGFRFFLIDANGREHHEWRIPDSVLDRVIDAHDWPLKAHQYEVMGAHLDKNGDVTFNINFHALAKIDRCSNLIWYLGERNHHSVYIDGDGFIWVPSRRLIMEKRPDLPRIVPPFYEDLVLKISPDGQVLETISVLEAAFRGGFQGLILDGDEDYPVATNRDPTHLNDIELVSASFAEKNDFASEGDIVVSLRTLDTVAIIAKDTHEMKYALSGLVLRQHDPDLRDNGNMLVFDNRTSQGQHNGARYVTERPELGYSRIVEVDPRTQKIVWSFQGSEAVPFYTSIQGELQELDNGNILVVETEGGRVFEIDRLTGGIVWQYRNTIGENSDGLRLGRITGASRVRKDDLTFVGQSCG